MKHYLIGDKQGNIVIQNFGLDLSTIIIKTTIEELKKDFKLIHYLGNDLQFVEYLRKKYSEYMEEELRLLEVDVELNVKILNN